MQHSWLRSKLAKLVGTTNRQTGNKPRRRRFQPLLEELEDRSLLSTLVWKGGTGNWDKTSLNWVVKGTAAPVAWTDGNDAEFGGTPGTVSLQAPIAAKNINFLATSYVIDANTLTLSGNVDVAPTFSDNFTGQVAGTLNKTNTGTLTLGGAKDNPGLIVSVAAGNLTLAKGSTAAIHAAAAVTDVAAGATLALAGTGGDQIADTTGMVDNVNAAFVGSYDNRLPAFRMSGGTLDLNGTSETLPTLAGSGKVTSGKAGAVTLTVGGNGRSALFAGTASGIQNGTGTVALTKIGSGTEVLTGAHTYTGKTTVTLGNLELGFNGTDGSIDGTSDVALAPLTSLIFNRSDAVTFSKVISGNGNVTKAGSGGLTLMAANTYTGGTNILNGTLTVGTLADAVAGPSALGPSTGGGNNQLTIRGGTLQYKSDSNATSVRSVVLGNGTIDVVPATGGGPAPTLTLSGVVRDALQVGTNRNISNLPGNQRETAVIINPTNPLNLVAGSNDLQSGLFTNFDDVWYSYDGGLTWTVEPIPNPTGQVSKHGDPAFVFDASGTVHYGHLTGDGTAADTLSISAAISKDGGQTWQPAAVTPGPMEGEDALGDDKELLAVGPDKADPTKQRVYVTFHRSNVIQALSSADGLTYQPGVPLPVSDPLTLGIDSVVGVGPSGNVYVAWENYSEPGKSLIMFNKSTNFNLLATGGAKFSDQNTLAFRTTVNPFKDFPSLQSFKIPAQPARGIWAGLSMVVDQNITRFPPKPLPNGGTTPGGRIYIAFANQEQVGGHNNTGIYLIASDDEGVTWTALGANPLRVNDDASYASQFFSWLAVDPTTGNLAVSWLDARDDPNNVKVKEYLAFSTDGGKTFGKNIPVAAGQSDASTVGGNFGDYTALDFYGGVAYPVWADNSTSPVPAPQGEDVTMATVLAVVGRLTKTGAGTLALTNAANTFDGGTVVSGGTLAVNSDGALGTAPAAAALNVTLDGGVLAATDDVPLNANRNLALTAKAGSQLTEVAGKTLTVAGVIADAAGNNQDPNNLGTFTVGGAGTVLFTALNTYKENTTVNAGTTLQLGDKTRNYNSSKSIVPGLITDNGALVFTRTDLVVHTGKITGTGTVTQKGDGILVLTADSDWSGKTTVDTGELLVEGLIKNDGRITLANNGQLVFKIFLNFNASPQTYRDFEYKGVIDGTGFVVKKGGNELKLSGVNTFTGFILVNQGVLTIANDNNLGTPPNMGVLADPNDANQKPNLIMAGGRLRTSGNVMLDPSRIILLTSKNVTFDVTGTLTIGGPITGRQTLYKSGPGTLVLATSRNSYTGGTNIAAGSLSIDKDGELGNVPAKATVNVVLSGGTLLTTDTFTLNANRTIKVAASSTIEVSTGKQLTIDGVFANDTGNPMPTLTKGGTGTGSLFLTGDSRNFTGTVTDAKGQLTVKNSAHLDMAAVMVSAGARLTGDGTTGNITVAGTFSPGPTATTAGTFNGTGTLTMNGGSTYVVFLDSAAVDATTVAMAANIGGAVLSVTTASAFNMALNTEFTILMGSSVTGTFTFNGGALATDTEFTVGAFKFKLKYSANKVTIRRTA